MIEMKSAAYSYGDELLSELNISISQGSFYFLTGPSGSGKTTFLKMCYGSLVPTSGALTIFGKESSDCLLYTSPSPRDRQKSRMPSSA